MTRRVRTDRPPPKHITNPPAQADMGVSNSLERMAEMYSRSVAPSDRKIVRLAWLAGWNAKGRLGIPTQAMVKP